MGFANTVKDNVDYRSFPKALKDGVNRRRVLPGVHICSETGEWAVKHNTHTISVPRTDDPLKFDYYTFHCPEVIEWVNREKIVLETCPECQLIAEQDTKYKAQAAAVKAQVDSGKMTKDAARAAMRPMLDWKKRHSKSFWWAVNVMDSEGKMFTEKWPHKDVKMAFDGLKKRLKDEENIGAILPLDQGVWVDITKTPSNETGTGFPSYKIEVAMEKLATGGKKEKLAPISVDSGNDAERSCWDLHDCGIMTLTRQQVKDLAESGDSPAVVRAIMGQSKKVEAPKLDLTEQPVPEPVSVSGSEVTTPEPVSEALPTPLAAPVESDEDKELRELQERLAAAQAQRALSKAAQTSAKPVAAPAPTPAPVVPPPAAKPETKTQSDELDFLREYELNG